MKTRSRKVTVSSGTNSTNENFNEKFKESTHTSKSLTNNEPIKNSTLGAKTPFAEISNTINRNGNSNNARDSTKRKVSNVLHPSEYSDSPILVSRFKKNLENKLPKTGHTNLKENCSVSELNDLLSPIIKTRKINNITSTEPISISDFIEENPVTSESKSNDTKVGHVKEESTTKIIKGRKRHEQFTNETSNKIIDASLFNSLPATARRSMRNKNKTTPSTMKTDVKGPPKTSVNKKEEKMTTKRITKATQKSNPVTRNTRKESKENNKILASEEKTTKCSLPNKVKQKGTRLIKGRKNIRESCEIENMSVNEAGTFDNKLATRKLQNTGRVFPKNINADTKSQEIATVSVQVNDKEIGVDSLLPSPSTQTNSSDKPQARLSKREQLALALRQGKLKSTVIPNSSNKGIIYEPAVGNNTGSKQKNIKGSIPKTKKVCLQNKTKYANLSKMQSLPSKEDFVDGKSSKITVPCSPSVSCAAKKGPIYFDVSKSSNKRKVLKTRKSISDAYDLSIESDMTPNPIIKKKKPKSRCVKSKVAPKKQNKFTVLTTDPNFEKHFHSVFAVKPFYGKSDPNINKNSSYKNSNPLCNTDIDNHSDDFVMPHDEDDPQPEISLPAIVLHPPKESDEHEFKQPSANSKNSNRTLNSSYGSNKSTPEGFRQLSTKFLGTSTPFTNNSNKMSSSSGGYLKPKQPVKTVDEDIAACFDFDEADGEEEELQIGLSLPLIKNIQHLLASTGNYSTDSIENNSCIPKSDESNHNNWSVSQIENVAGCSPKLKTVATKSKKKLKENINLDGTFLFEDIEDEKRIEKSQIAKQFEVENKRRRDTPGIVLSPEKSFVIPANKTYDRQSLDASRAALFEKISGGLPTDDEDENMSHDEFEPVKKRKSTKNNLSKTKELNGKKKESVAQSVKVTKSNKRKVDKESTLSTTSHLSNSTMNVSKKSKLNEKTIEDWASGMMGHFSKVDESALLVECDQ